MIATSFVGVLALTIHLACKCNGNQTNTTAGGPATHEIYTPELIHWAPSPPSLPPGAKTATLEGDVRQPGFFTMRAHFPAGYRIAPHTHPNAERVTVISGTLYLGEGDQFDESKAVALPAGSYSTMPPGMKHFAFTKEDTVIQVSSIGPWGIAYVNPADDPRNAAAAASTKP